MSERPVTTGTPGHYGEPAGKEAVELDREIQFRQLVVMGVALVAIAALSAVAVFFLLRGFLRAEQAAAGPPPIMAPQKTQVPGPVLLARPESELARVRAAETERLTTYGWVDPAGQVARIPIERAMELIAERGLPARAPLAAPPVAADPAAAGAGNPASPASPASAPPSPAAATPATTPPPREGHRG